MLNNITSPVVRSILMAALLLILCAVGGSARTDPGGAPTSSGNGWEMLKIVKVVRTTAPPSDLFRPPSLKPGFQWWQVFFEVKNASDAMQFVVSPTPDIFLSHRGTRYVAVDVLWEGSLPTQMQISGGQVMTRLSIGGGETATLSPAFMVPANLPEAEVQLHFLSAAPIALGGAGVDCPPPAAAKAPSPAAPATASIGTVVLPRAGAERTGAFRTEGPQQSPTLKWKLKLGGEIIASPVVADGVLFVGSTGGNFFAVDVGTGQVKWKSKVKGMVVASAAVSGGAVIFGTSSGQILALDIATGQTRWTYSIEFGAPMWAAPLVIGDVAWRPTMLGDLLAIDVQTGQSKGSYRTYAPISVAPAAAQHTLYFINWDKDVFAFDTSVHSNTWKQNTGSFFSTDRFLGTIPSAPALADGMVFVTSSDAAANPGYVLALDQQTGKEKWKFVVPNDLYWQRKTASALGSLPGCAPGLRSLKNYDSTSKLRLMLGSAGERVWTPVTGDYFSSAPAIHDGVLYIGRDNRVLYALQASSGEKLWEFATCGIIQSSPVVASGLVYIGSTDHWLYALEAKTGKERWRFDLSTEILSSPFVDNGVLYVGSRGGYLYALK